MISFFKNLFKRTPYIPNINDIFSVIEYLEMDGGLLRQELSMPKDKCISMWYKHFCKKGMKVKKETLEAVYNELKQ